MPSQRADTHSLQNAFHARLTLYVNGGHLAPGDLALSGLSVRLSRKRHETKLKQEFQNLVERSAQTSEAPSRQLRIPAYDGYNPQVRALQDALAGCEVAIRSAFVHGSLATGDAVPYSDLDALVILRDGLFAESGQLAATAALLSRARGTMFAFDPLQHHGWFVLTESDLSQYAESYLPVAAIERSRSLLAGEQELELRVRPSRAEALESLAEVATGLLRQCADPARPRNLYQAKSFLSRFMLLPAIHLHARDGAGVYKGKSFAAARNDFPASAWQAMDRASAVRSVWDYPTPQLRRALLTASLVARPFLLRQLAPPIPQSLGERLNDNFYQGVAALTELFLDKARQMSRDERLAP